MFRNILALTMLLAASWCAPAAAASNELVSDLCLLPVKNGRPTEEDVGATWRMIEKVVLLDGIDKPIIYPLNRGGVWTIGYDYSFSRFGGEFPNNFIHDSFVRDPITRSTVGINPHKGVFVIRPGETAFTPLYKLDGGPLRHPGSAAYVGRFKGTVLYDPSGLYLLDQKLRLQKLPLDKRFQRGVQSLIDLPAIKALLFSSDNNVFLRDDSGHVILLATLQKWDTVNQAVVTASGMIKIRAYWSEFEIAPPARGGSGHFLEVEDADVARPRGIVSRPLKKFSEATLGKRKYVFTNKELMVAKRHGEFPVAMPFDPAKTLIEKILEYRRAQKIVVFSHAGIHTLDADGIWEKVPGSKGRIGYGTKIVDLKSEKGMLVVAKDALYLLIPSRDKAAKECLR